MQTDPFSYKKLQTLQDKVGYSSFDPSKLYTNFPSSVQFNPVSCLGQVISQKVKFIANGVLISPNHVVILTKAIASNYHQQQITPEANLEFRPLLLLPNPLPSLQQREANSSQNNKEDDQGTLTDELRQHRTCCRIVKIWHNTSKPFTLLQIENSIGLDCGYMGLVAGRNVNFYDKFGVMQKIEPVFTLSESRTQLQECHAYDVTQSHMTLQNTASRGGPALAQDLQFGLALLGLLEDGSEKTVLIRQQDIITIQGWMLGEKKDNKISNVTPTVTPKNQQQQQIKIKTFMEHRVIQLKMGEDEQQSRQVGFQIAGQQQQQFTAASNATPTSLTSMGEPEKIVQLIRLNNELLAYNTTQQTIKVWNWKQSKIVQVLHYQGQCRAMKRNRTHLLATSDQVLLLIDWTSPQMEVYLDAYTCSEVVYAIENVDRYTVAVALGNGDFSLIQFMNPKNLQVEWQQLKLFSKAHAGRIQCFATMQQEMSDDQSKTKDELFLFSGGEFGQIKMWNLTQQIHIKDLQSFECVAGDKSPQQVNQNGSQQFVSVNSNTGKEHIVVTALCLNPQIPNSLISCSQDRLLICWDYLTGHKLKKILLHNTIMQCEILNKQEIAIADDILIRIFSLNSWSYVKLECFDFTVKHICSLNEETFIAGDVSGAFSVLTVSDLYQQYLCRDQQQQEGGNNQQDQGEDQSEGALITKAMTKNDNHKPNNKSEEEDESSEERHRSQQIQDLHQQLISNNQFSRERDQSSGNNGGGGVEGVQNKPQLQYVVQQLQFQQNQSLAMDISDAESSNNQKKKQISYNNLLQHPTKEEGCVAPRNNVSTFSVAQEFGQVAANNKLNTTYEYQNQQQQALGMFNDQDSNNGNCNQQAGYEKVASLSSKKKQRKKETEEQEECKFQSAILQTDQGGEQKSMFVQQLEEMHLDAKRLMQQIIMFEKGTTTTQMPLQETQDKIAAKSNAKLPQQQQQQSNCQLTQEVQGNKQFSFSPSPNTSHHANEENEECQQQLTLGGSKPTSNHGKSFSQLSLVDQQVLELQNKQLKSNFEYMQKIIEQVKSPTTGGCASFQATKLNGQQPMQSPEILALDDHNQASVNTQQNGSNNGQTQIQLSQAQQLKQQYYKSVNENTVLMQLDQTQTMERQESLATFSPFSNSAGPGLQQPPPQLQQEQQQQKKPNGFNFAQQENTQQQAHNTLNNIFEHITIDQAAIQTHDVNQKGQNVSQPKRSSQSPKPNPNEQQIQRQQQTSTSSFVSNNNSLNPAIINTSNAVGDNSYHLQLNLPPLLEEGTQEDQQSQYSERVGMLQAELERQETMIKQKNQKIKELVNHNNVLTTTLDQRENVIKGFAQLETQLEKSLQIIEDQQKIIEEKDKRIKELTNQQQDSNKLIEEITRLHNVILEKSQIIDQLRSTTTTATTVIASKSQLNLRQSPAKKVSETQPNINNENDPPILVSPNTNAATSDVNQQQHKLFAQETNQMTYSIVPNLMPDNSQQPTNGQYLQQQQQQKGVSPVQAASSVNAMQKQQIPFGQKPAASIVVLNSSDINQQKLTQPQKRQPEAAGMKPLSTLQQTNAQNNYYTMQQPQQPQQQPGLSQKQQQVNHNYASAANLPLINSNQYNKVQNSQHQGSVVMPSEVINNFCSTNSINNVSASTSMQQNCTSDRVRSVSQYSKNEKRGISYPQQQQLDTSFTMKPNSSFLMKSPEKGGKNTFNNVCPTTNSYCNHTAANQQLQQSNMGNQQDQSLNHIQVASIGLGKGQTQVAKQQLLQQQMMSHQQSHQHQQLQQPQSQPLQTVTPPPQLQPHKRTMQHQKQISMIY